MFWNKKSLVFFYHRLDRAKINNRRVFICRYVDGWAKCTMVPLGRFCFPWMTPDWLLHPVLHLFCELTVCPQLLHAQILFLQDKPTAHLKLRAASAFSTNSKNEFTWKHTLIYIYFFIDLTTIFSLFLHY